MREVRENKHNRVYHLISRIARRAFFLDAYGAVRDGGGTGSAMDGSRGARRYDKEYLYRTVGARQI